MAVGRQPRRCFNPRAPRGARPQLALAAGGEHMFQSTRPARGATFEELPIIGSCIGFNPRAPRGARPGFAGRVRGLGVSIHAPRAGRDISEPWHVSFRCVSIHAPRAGRDIQPNPLGVRRRSFNPRAPRGARRQRPPTSPSVLAVSIHAPRAGRDIEWTDATSALKVSIHAPRAGRDAECRKAWDELGVSIHAPRAGRDGRQRSVERASICFNPRAPRGARPDNQHKAAEGGWFQSTRPARGATDRPYGWQAAVRVSIHAPRAGRDSGKAPRSLTMGGFNPRAPRGARPNTPVHGLTGDMFQSTRPARGATLCDAEAIPPNGFQSTRPARGATALEIDVMLCDAVSIHAPRAGRDDNRLGPHRWRGGFNPRAPRGARRLRIFRRRWRHRFQSTRPARGATPRLA